jgi:hypothetical protein
MIQTGLADSRQWNNKFTYLSKRLIVLRSTCAAAV